MITIVCMSCGTAIRITGEHNEMESLFGGEKTFPCPTCGEDSEEVDSIEQAAFRSLDLHDLTPQEAFAAFNGLGLPKERDCGSTAVSALLIEKRIVAVEGEMIKGTNRTVIRHIEFQDGTKMYLGASAYGAMVYRIQPKRSFTEEVLRENL